MFIAVATAIDRFRLYEVVVRECRLRDIRDADVWTGECRVVGSEPLLDGARGAGEGGVGDFFGAEEHARVDFTNDETGADPRDVSMVLRWERTGGLLNW